MTVNRIVQAKMSKVLQRNYLVRAVFKVYQSGLLLLLRGIGGYVSWQHGAQP